MRIEREAATALVVGAIAVNESPSPAEAYACFVAIARDLADADAAALVAPAFDGLDTTRVHAGSQPPYGSSLELDLGDGLQMELGWVEPDVDTTAAVESVTTLARLTRIAELERRPLQETIESQLVQNAKLAAVGELAAGVAHEINNPLFAILGLTEFLLNEIEPGTKQHERLQLIQQTGLEIKETIRALLEFTRENPDEHYLVDLADVARQTIDLVRRTNANKGVTIEERYPAEPVEVVASPNQLKQVLLNLLANARQAMPHGGTITVTVRRAGTTAVVSVGDTGDGVAEDVRNRIFEPFFTTRREAGGTGLGLAVGFGIAKAHGGSLTLVDSDSGACFLLHLPLVGAQ